MGDEIVEKASRGSSSAPRSRGKVLWLAVSVKQRPASSHQLQKNNGGGRRTAILCPTFFIDRRGKAGWKLTGWKNPSRGLWGLFFQTQHQALSLPLRQPSTLRVATREGVALKRKGQAKSQQGWPYRGPESQPASPQPRPREPGSSTGMHPHPRHSPQQITKNNPISAAAGLSPPSHRGFASPLDLENYFF